MTTYSTDSNNSEDVVNFPVPKKYLSATIQALARIIEADQQGGSPQNAKSETSAVPKPTPEQEVEKIHLEWPDEAGGATTYYYEPNGKIYIKWDEAKLRILRKYLHNTAALTLLDMTAEEPNERVYVEDVMQMLGCTHGKVGAGLGVLTKTINKIFGLNKKRYNWPAPFHWDAEQQRAYYLMDDAVAEAWWNSATDNETPMQ